MRSHKPLAVASAFALSGSMFLTTDPGAEAATGTARAVAAIGDSYPRGEEGYYGRSYVELYGRRTGQRALNWSYSGWRTGDVLYSMRSTPIQMRNLRDARTVIVTIGANDISETYPDPTAAATTLAPYNAELHAMRNRLHTILGLISQVRGHNNSRVVVTDYNQIYMDGTPLSRQSAAYQKGSERLTQQVNAVIMAECRYYGMACVDVYPTFQRSRVDYCMTPDGTHPNAQGHQIYANLIYAKVH